VDGVGAAASFNAKNAGLAYGADGLLYLADWQNHKLRTIAADGTVATLANVRTAGPPCAVAVAPDGTIYFCTYNAKTSGLYVLEQGKPRAIATSPRATGSDLPPDTFGVPLALVLDAAGNAYLADYYRNVIDKVTLDGHVSRFAGSGDAGFADGPAAQARFRSPIDLAFGRDGMLYVADRFNNRIRGIAPDGTVSTIAGWGAGKRVGKLATARFRDLRALAVDAGGHLVVADRSAHGLRIVR
jgi:sugar lactone lactonase YvrE